MIKQSEWVLMHLLKCGQADLSILDDVEYDLDDILDELVECNNLSLENLIVSVFQKGIDELCDLVENAKIEVIDNLQILDKTIPKESDSDEVIDQKEAEIDENDVYLSYKYDIEWGDKIPEYIEEISEIDPLCDVNYYFNFLCTYIYFENHKEIYSKFFRDQVAQIEEKIGFSFTNF